MPLYVYTCKKCAKLFEILVSLNEYDKPIKCPHCGEKLNRIMCPVRFKI